MKSTKLICIISVIGLTVVVLVGIRFINDGLGDNYIHEVPNGDIEKIYDTLLNLYQARVNVANWIIACIGCLLTFLAFYIQFDYNNRQKEDIAQERLENKLFHLLDVYRTICNNTLIENVGKGKVAYHYMFYEYKAIYNIIKENKAIHSQITFKDEQTLNYIAFTYFINGVTVDKIETSIPDEIFPVSAKVILRDTLLRLQAKSERAQVGGWHEGPSYLKDYSNRRIKYFDGHRLRFVPYIKYISLILEFIRENVDVKKREKTLKFLSKEQTDHELGLIYAHEGYLRYLQNNSNEKDLLQSLYKDKEDLWQSLYKDIDKSIANRIKYDSGEFIS